MDTPSTIAAEGFGPTMTPPTSTGKADFFIIGTDDKPQDDRVVAVSISVRAMFKVGDREFSTTIGLHEALVLQSYLHASSGGCTLTLSGGWVPGIDRYRKLTQTTLKVEVERLCRMQVPRKDAPPLDCFGQFFPGNMTERIKRVHAVMTEQFTAWEALMKTVRTRVVASSKETRPAVVESLACEYITEQEINAIRDLANPGAGQLAELVLPEVTFGASPAVAEASGKLDDIIARAHAIADSSTHPVDAAMERLETAGFDANTSGKVASLLEQFGSADKVPDASIVEAAGSKAKLAAAKQALKG